MQERFAPSYKNIRGVCLLIYMKNNKNGLKYVYPGCHKINSLKKNKVSKG